MKATSTRLIFRLSSMGDIILATAALEALPPGEKSDWVVAREFAELLRDHPRIGRVWEYDRRTGLKGWLELCGALELAGYREVFDLHRSLRTRVARTLFLFRGLRRGKAASWSTLRKERARLTGFFLLRRAWPRAFRPRPLMVRVVEAVTAQVSRVRTDFAHFADGADLPGDFLRELKGSRSGGSYLCVMPGAQWPGKRWPARRFADVFQGLDVPIVVLGSERDQESRELVGILKVRGANVIDGVGRWSLPLVARILAGAAVYVGNDTGLAHLSEAVGTRAFVVFGPTAPDVGFGPWRPESRAFGSDLWCRPCGKDGRYCFRLTQRYSCLSGYEGKDLSEALARALEKTPAQRQSPR